MVWPFTRTTKDSVADAFILRRAYETGDTTRSDIRERIGRFELLANGWTSRDIDEMDLDDIVLFATLADLRYSRLGYWVAKHLMGG